MKTKQSNSNQQNGEQDHLDQPKQGAKCDLVNTQNENEEQACDDWDHTFGEQAIKEDDDDNQSLVGAADLDGQQDDQITTTTGSANQMTAASGSPTACPIDEVRHSNDLSPIPSITRDRVACILFTEDVQRKILVECLAPIKPETHIDKNEFVVAEASSQTTCQINNSHTSTTQDQDQQFKTKKRSNTDCSQSSSPPNGNQYKSPPSRSSKQPSVVVAKTSQMKNDDDAQTSQLANQQCVLPKDNESLLQKAQLSDVSKVHKNQQEKNTPVHTLTVYSEDQLTRITQFLSDMFQPARVWSFDEFSNDLEQLYNLTRIRYTKGGHKTNQDMKLRQSFICQCHGRGSHSRSAIHRKRDHYFSQSQCKSRISIKQVKSGLDQWFLDKADLQHNHEPQSLDYFQQQRLKEITEEQRIFITQEFNKNNSINGAEVRKRYQQKFGQTQQVGDMFGKKVQNLLQLLRQGKDIVSKQALQAQPDSTDLTNQSYQEPSQIDHVKDSSSLQNKSSKDSRVVDSQLSSKNTKQSVDQIHNNEALSKRKRAASHQVPRSAFKSEDYSSMNGESHYQSKRQSTSGQSNGQNSRKRDIKLKFKQSVKKERIFKRIERDISADDVEDRKSSQESLDPPLQHQENEEMSQQEGSSGRDSLQNQGQGGTASSQDLLDKVQNIPQPGKKQATNDLSMFLSLSALASTGVTAHKSNGLFNTKTNLNSNGLVSVTNSHHSSEQHSVHESPVFGFRPPKPVKELICDKNTAVKSFQQTQHQISLAQKCALIQQQALQTTPMQTASPSTILNDLQQQLHQQNPLIQQQNQQQWQQYQALRMQYAYHQMLAYSALQKSQILNLYLQGHRLSPSQKQQLNQLWQQQDMKSSNIANLAKQLMTNATTMTGGSNINYTNNSSSVGGSSFPLTSNRPNHGFVPFSKQQQQDESVDQQQSNSPPNILGQTLGKQESKDDARGSTNQKDLQGSKQAPITSPEAKVFFPQQQDISKSQLSTNDDKSSEATKTQVRELADNGTTGAATTTSNNGKEHSQQDTAVITEQLKKQF